MATVNAAGRGSACSAALVLVVALTVASSDGQVAQGRVSCSVSGALTTHTVQQGDSLASLGARYGTDALGLAEDNQLRPGSVLRAGDVLRLDTRHIVPSEAIDGVVINIPQRMLFVARQNRLLAAYPVAVGRPDWPSPTGTFEIGVKEVDPTWDVPVSIQREMAEAGKRVLTTVPPGAENPLGDRWLGLKGIGVGIHGTNQPTSVFRFTTHGCIRLHPDDARHLFDLVEIGSPVSIVYQPVLVAIDEDARVWLEVHRDAYRRVGDLSRVAGDLLRDAGVADPLADADIRVCVQERRGRVCEVKPSKESRRHTSRP
jgi:L,D-transpeptidase ErfK/SrfK